jgi:hypothetical protein
VGGGSAAGGGGAPACADDFCVVGFTLRPPPFNINSGLLGDTLEGGLAFFTNFGSSNETIMLQHNPGATPTQGDGGSLGPLTYFPYTVGVGIASDFFTLVGTDRVNAQLVRFVNRVGQTLWTGRTQACEGRDFSAFAVARRDANTLVLGGYNDSICLIDLTTRQTRLLRAASSNPSNQHVNQIWASPTGEIFWGSDDGYVSELDAGHVSDAYTTGTGWGVMGISGTSRDNVWALISTGDVLHREADGGFVPFAKLEETAYSIAVTPDGVFVGAFNGIFHKTAFTDGGFERYFLPPPISSLSRASRMCGGRGFLHVGGDFGSYSDPDGAFFFTLRPRNQ